MLRLLTTPRWVIATIVVLGVAALFVALGLWQLRRHDARTIENAVVAARLDAPRSDLEMLLRAAGGDVDSLAFRRVEVTGHFDQEGEILVRSQVSDERPGFHVVTPLRTGFGTVLVNRGWVPLAVEAPPVHQVPPPEGPVTIEGVVRASQVRPAIGPVEPPGRLAVVARIDLDRLREQFDGLVDVWVQQTDEPVDALPVRVQLPPIDDTGPHLAYAIQWFTFALIGLVGFGILARRAVAR